MSCADPATIKVESGDGDTWYLYCVSNALFTGDREHSIDVFESKDLIGWTYDGNALTGRPSWAPDGPLGSPAIEYMNGQYMLYYTSPSSKISATKGPAIGVGVSSSPKGPFIDHGLPVAEPATGDCCVGRPRSMIELDVEQSNAQNGDNSIGPGRNVLFTDESGQDYILYRYPGARDCTTCPAWISPLDWSSDGWPTVGQVHVDFQDQLENSFKRVE